MLVGGFNPSEKYESVGVTISNIWKKQNFQNHQPVMKLHFLPIKLYENSPLHLCWHLWDLPSLPGCLKRPQDSEWNGDVRHSIGDIATVY